MSGELLIKWADGELSVVQVAALAARLDQLRPQGGCHWHFNDCGCCVTVHGKDSSYVIGRDGGETFYAKRGCECAQ